MHSARRVVCVVVLLAVTASAEARIINANPADYRARVSQLMPGDTLRLAPGDYLQRLPIHGLNGRADAPIRIEAQDPRARPRFLAQRGRNTVSIADSSFIEIRGLDLDGLGLPVDAVTAERRARFAHHITLESLLIQGHGVDQQEVGISTKCPAWNWVVRGNVIIGAGTGMYFGNSDGNAPFVGGVIEHNLVRDTRGYNLQVKHQNARPELPGMPAGQSFTIIRHNVFSKEAGASTAELARPNVLVGHFPRDGPGVDDRYLIYGNFFHQNPTEALFQGEGHIAFYSNVLVNLGGSAVHIQPHKGRPQSVDVFGNTVIARDVGIVVTGGDPEHVQRVFGNLVFAGSPLPGMPPAGNLTGGMAEASGLLRDPFAALGRLDLAPRSTSAVITSKWPELPSGYIAAGADFEGRPRVSGVTGAYTASSTVWRLALDRKPALGSPPTSDAAGPRGHAPRRVDTRRTSNSVPRH